MFCILLCFQGMHTTAKELLIKNARLFDGTGTPPRLVSIHVIDGKIINIGQQFLKNDAEVIDVHGATVLPGLIDAHVHLQWIPGSVYRKDDPEQLRKFRLHHLRAYLASGVTTVLDTGISASVLNDIHNHLKSGGIGPRVFALGPIFRAPRGYLGEDMKLPTWGPLWRAAATERDIKDLFKEYEGLPNIVGVKVHIEFGFGPFDIWPIHTPEIRNIIQKESKNYNRPIYVHGHDERERNIGLEMGAHAMTHNSSLEGSPSKDFIQRMKTQGTYLTTTLSNAESWLAHYHLERLEDPLIQLTVPKEEITTARDPMAWELMTQITFRTAIFPKWVPTFIPNYLGPLILDQDKIQKQYQNVSKAVFTMYQAGIPIVVGSDSGNLPHLINMFHGSSTIREIELLGEAGIPSIDVLSSATRIPAEMMGVDHLIGTIEVGKRADLIVVQDDPFKNLHALRELLWVIKDGEARRPKDWMKQ